MKSAPSFKHLSHLDGLRALAAMFVVLHHAFLQVDFTGYPLAYPVRKFLNVFYFGHYAVDLFIVLSGFCLMLPVISGGGRLRGGILDFFRRRALRILPPYYLAMLLSLLLIGLFVGHKTGTHWDVSLPVTGKSILTHLLLVQDVFHEDTTINHAFWSIAVEWRIYFLFPLLLWAWRYMGALGTTGLAIFLSYALFRFCAHVLGASLSAQYAGLFTMGMLGATVSFSPSNNFQSLKRLPWGWICLLAGLLVIILSQAKIWRGGVMPVYLIDYFVGAWSVSLLITASNNPDRRFSRMLRYKPLAFIGTFAYSVYLIHAPLLQILWQYPMKPLRENPLLMFSSLSLIGMPVILALAYLFFIACERPFHRYEKRKKATGFAGKGGPEFDPTR